MTEKTSPQNIDESHVAMIGHISIRDPDTGEVILRQRDTAIVESPVEEKLDD